jgi:hypothetical protein
MKSNCDSSWLSFLPDLIIVDVLHQAPAMPLPEIPFRIEAGSSKRCRIADFQHAPMIFSACQVSHEQAVKLE